MDFFALSVMIITEKVVSCHSSLRRLGSAMSLIWLVLRGYDESCAHIASNEQGSFECVMGTINLSSIQMAICAVHS